MYKLKYKSECYKYGNNPEHEQAVATVEQFLKKYGQGEWIYIPEFTERYNPKFLKQEKISTYPGHSYDLAVTTPFDIENPFLYIEVDGEKHPTELQRKMKIYKNTQQLRNDQQAERYIQFLKRDIIRLEKSKCIGSPADIKQYLKEKLANYLK